MVSSVPVPVSVGVVLEPDDLDVFSVNANIRNAAARSVHSSAASRNVAEWCSADGENGRIEKKKKSKRIRVQRAGRMDCINRIARLLSRVYETCVCVCVRAPRGSRNGTRRPITAFRLSQEIKNERAREASWRFGSLPLIRNNVPARGRETLGHLLLPFSLLSLLFVPLLRQDLWP